MKKKFASASLCLLTAVIWGFAFSAQEIASQKSDLIDAFFFNGIRFFIGAVSLIPVILIFEREKEKNPQKTKHTILYGVIVGVILFTASSLQQFGIQLTGESGKVGFITGLYLIFVPIVSFIIFKQKISPLVWGAMAFAVCGLYFLCLGGDGFTLQVGDLLAITGAFFWTAHIICVDKFVHKVSALKFSCVQFFTVAVLDIIMGLIFGHVSIEGIKATVFPILYCGLLSTGVAYTCQIIGQKFTPPTIAALLFSTEGLFSVIAECLVEHKLPSQTMLIGCILMFIGVILSQVPFSKEERLKLFAKKNKKNKDIT
jgi:drug/metabolite transporter (DMT)-like permease